jgi:hypothetical protein
MQITLMLISNSTPNWARLSEYISVGRIRGNDKPIAGLIKKRAIDAKSSGIKVKEVFFTFGVMQVDEGLGFHPEIMILFEAPSDKAATRFAKSLNPEVFGQSLVVVSREPTGMFTVHSNEEFRAYMQHLPQS